MSQFPDFLNKTYTLDVPVYTVWGACEDVQVLEKLRSGEYKIDNLNIIDEAHSKLLEIGGVKLRLLGLGGAVVMHKLFDNGEGKTTIAGGQGTMWTTLLQMGELVDTANRNYDPTETRVLVTHASPAREGLLNQLSVALKVDFSISAGLHFRYGSSYNEFSVNPTLDHYRGKLAASKASFNDVWETVKSQVEPAVAENEVQQKLLANALDIVNKMPSVANGSNPFGGHVGPNTGQIDEMAFKNMWNFNLADAAFGWLVLEVEGGRIGTEMKAQGFNFAHRGMKNPVLQADMGRVQSPSVSGQASVAPAQPPQSAQAPAQPRVQAPSIASIPPPPYSPAGPQARPAHQQRQQSAQQPPAAQGTASPAPQPTQYPPQPQAPKPAATPATTARSAPSPATPAVSQAPKPAAAPPASAPATAAAAPNGVQKDSSANEPTTNGAAPTGATSDATAPKEASATYEKKITDGIFIVNTETEEDVRNLFSEEDKAKIQRVEKRGPGWIAHFASPEEATTVLAAAPRELKGRPMPGKPNMKAALDRPPTRYDGAGGWGSSTRGNAQQGNFRGTGGGENDGGRGGRGAFRGRGRGSERGRGARGGRGDRGGFTRTTDGSAPAASSTPAPAASGGAS